MSKKRFISLALSLFLLTALILTPYNATQATEVAAVIVDWGSGGSGNVYGITGWNTPFMDVYTGYSSAGPDGTTIVTGHNPSYDYQGITGTPRTFSEGEIIRVTWYNNAASSVTFTPKLCFDYEGRVINGGTWYNMSQVTVPAGSSGVTIYEVTALSAGNHSKISVNNNFSNYGTLICDKIELITESEPDPTPTPSPIYEFTDDFVTETNQALSAYTSPSGYAYAGADVLDFSVEASTDSIYAPGDPDGHMAWWATPNVVPQSSNYRAVTNSATLGGTNEWFCLYAGVRHNGNPRGSETVYDLRLRGGSGGLHLRRVNSGVETILASDSGFTTNNGIGASTPVDLEIEAVTVGDTVVLNAWVTVNNGTRQNVFQDVVDSSASRITEAGRPAFGLTPIAPRIGGAGAYAAEEPTPTPDPTPEPTDPPVLEDFSDEFNAQTDENLSEHISDSGHSYTGADASDFVVEASTDSICAPGEPDGHMAWWAVPNINFDSENYRVIAKNATLGGTNQYFCLYAGVRHNGNPRGSETVYDLRLRGGNGGLHLRRVNSGVETILASDSGFTTNNSIGASTSVTLEIEAANVGSDVVLNAWVTVDGGTRQNVFQSIVDSSASRITASGHPAFGLTPIAPRIGGAEAYEIEAPDPTPIPSPTPTPTPTPGGGDPVAPEPPLLSMYEQDMVYHGKAVGDWQQTVSTQDSQYYDGLRVHQQIRDYARANISSSQATLYLNNVARYISRSIQVVRNNYVIPNDGKVQDWRRFPKGLYYHYLETGDQDSYDALLMLRDGKTNGTGDPLNHPEFGQASWMREMSYWLQAHIWGEKLDGTRNVAKVSKYVEYLESQLRQVRNNDYTDPTYGDGDNDYMQSFYMGLCGMALIEWYEHAGNTYWPTDNWDTIPDALRDVFWWMMDQGPDGAKIVLNADGTPDPNVGKPLWIENYNNSGYGLFHRSDRILPGGSTTAPYTDVQNLITPVYYWIGVHFNDAEFIELGDKVFAGAVYHQTYWTDGMYGKRLGEMFLTSMDGLRWRQMYVDANNN